MAKDFHPPGARPAQGSVDSNAIPIGKWTSTYPDGSKASEITYNDSGQGVGIAYQWFQDGTKLLELDFSNNGEDIVQRTYFPNGQQESMSNVVQGIPHGPVKTWYPSGAVSAEGQYHLGRPHGEIHEYGPSGEVFNEVFTFGIPRDSKFSPVAILNGGLFTLVLLAVVAVGGAVLLMREGSALSGLLILALILVIHEFGHWVVARFVGIPVESFRVGIGPHLFTFVWKQTRFEVHLLPLIGWVKQATFWPGEFDQYQNYVAQGSAPKKIQGREGVPETPCPPTPACKFVSPSRRLAFYLGGIAINLLSAFLVLWISTYPTRPDKAALKCADIGARITVGIPTGIMQQLNPENFVEDTPGLLRGVRDSSRQGITFAQNFALISILIAVFNLLPVPPLDGFHVATTVMEKILGRKLEGRIYNFLMFVGVSFLLLMLVTGVFFLGRDLWKMLIGG